MIAVLDVVDRLFKLDDSLGLEGQKSFKNQVESYGGLDQLEALQSSANQEVNDKAVKICNEHIETRYQED